MKAAASSPSWVDIMAGVSVERMGEIVSQMEGWPGRNGWPHEEDLEEMNLPPGLTAEETWLGLQLGRWDRLRPLGLSDSGGRPYRFAVPDVLAESLHRLDGARDWPVGSDGGVGPRDREPWVTAGLIQEAVASAQLAGARTSWDEAKTMLLTSRHPRDQDERTMANVHRALLSVRSPEAVPLSPSRVQELHALLFDGLPYDPDGFASSHRLASLCALANGGEPNSFIHPVVRAVLLHALVLCERPFADGNGRLARVLFHASLFNQGYRIFECLSLSRELLRAPDAYAHALRRVVSGGNDLTYFLVHQMEAIDASMRVLADTLRRRTDEFREVEARLRGTDGLNHRQQALLVHALTHPGARYIIEGHRRCHGVVFQTARTDLFDLAGRGLLEVRKEGRVSAFYAPVELRDKLARLSGDLSEVPAYHDDTSLPVNLL